MKKSTKILGIISIPFAIGAALLCSAFLKKMSKMESEPARGLNGSFEFAKNGLPVNWHVYTPRTTKRSDFDIILDQQDPKEGRQSLLFKVRKCVATGGWHSPGFATEVNAKAGDQFKVSLWVKNSGSMSRVNITGIDALHSAQGQVVTISDHISNWRYMEYQYTIPPSMTRLRFEVNVLSPGSFWVDDVQIARK